MDLKTLLADVNGDFSTAIGYQALKTQNGVSGTVGSTAVGYQAGLAITTGVHNVAIGYLSLDEITTGGYNVAIGREALGNCDGAESENTAIGDRAGLTIDNGSNNILIGANAQPSTAAASNQIVLGKDATGVANNAVTLGNASTTAVYMAQDSGATVHAGILNLTGGQITTTSGNIALNANSGLVTTAAFQSTSANLSYFTGPLNLEGDVKFTKANGLKVAEPLITVLCPRNS